MMLGSFYFKQKGRASLKGNWQTALIITFCAGLFMTLASVVQSVYFPDVVGYMEKGEVERLAQDIAKVPSAAVLALGLLSLFNFVLSPALSLGSNQYFLCRLKGEELGFKGLFCRMHSFLRALWLYVVMDLRILGWSLLLFVPGVLAAIRYSMAPYYMAEDPTLTATEAIEKSKNAMKDMKLSYFSLMLSFISWSILAMLAQILLMELSVIVALAGAQFMQLAISTYMNASCAAFYQTVSQPEGVRAAQREIVDRMRQMGVEVPPAVEQEMRQQPSEENDASEDLSEGDEDGAADASIGSEARGNAPVEDAKKE
ncbi:MAG: DUF975 family protein [Clostridia bacterium]